MDDLKPCKGQKYFTEEDWRFILGYPGVGSRAPEEETADEPKGRREDGEDQ